MGVVTTVKTSLCVQLSLMALLGCTERRNPASQVAPPPQQQPPPKPKHEWDGYGDPNMDETYDVIDLVSAAPGDLVLVATANNWPRSLPRESRRISAEYHWSSRPMKSDVVDARLVMNDVLVACNEQQSCERRSSHVSVSGHYGCFYPEAKKGEEGSFDDGAAVMWCGNVLSVKKGSMLNHTKQDLVEAAIEAAWWHDQFLPDGRVPVGNPQVTRELVGQNRWLIHRALPWARSVRQTFNR